MKQKSLLIGCYALFILAGGITGYVLAGSLMSIVVSSLFTLLLLSCCYFISQGSMTAYNFATLLVGCLFFFFAYRFSITFKIAPAGIMTMLSFGLLVNLLISRKRIYVA